MTGRSWIELLSDDEKESVLRGIYLVRSRAVKTGGPDLNGSALTGFGLYRAGPKSPVEKRA